jgi:sulfide:quinone oxidoreductase
MAAASHHQVLIVGGGAAGITVAAELRRQDHADALEIAIIEPSDVHYYQPAFTLVGAGAYNFADTCKPERTLIPAGVRWIKDAAAAFAPENNTVTLASGGTVSYDYLVVCPGLVLNWDAVKGLRESVGANGVCSNYSPDTVEYTWEALKNIRHGGKVLCTQPPMPFKCPGAPQKIAYLAADNLRRRGIRKSCEVHFLTHAPAIFGVPFYARALVKIAAEHDIQVHYQHNLVEVDGPARLATFEIAGGDRQGQRITMPFDMLHATPSQTTPAMLKQSPLANAAGFADVHANSLQHVKYKNIFALGDAASTANSKTAAAVRKQAPVVVRNLLHVAAGRAVEDIYDGYAACPLTTAYGKVLMAEFIYGGKPTPTLPLDPGKDNHINWWIKTTGLPMLYWDYMLKGRVAFPAHDTGFVEPPVQA